MRVSRRSLTRVTAPELMPITLDEAKAHARVPDDFTAEDAKLIGIMRSATEFFDGATGYLARAIIRQTWDLTLDRFPGYSDEAIEIPLPPLISVSSVSYVDTAGATQTWSASEYQVDMASEPGRLLPAYNYRWPATRDQLAAVTIRFVAGYGSNPGDVPESIRLAIAQLTAHWYAEAEALAPGQVNRVPYNVENAVANYRVFTFR